MRRRATASILANPVLVGAVTTLVVIVAVFLAYNANNGLPFVPTSELKIELPNGAELVKGNEVREGGFRIGVVSAIRPVMLANGQVGALATLKLDHAAGALPQDTQVVVRPRSALGLKYVDLIKGSSPKTLADGATLPLSQASQETNLDDVYNIFDQPTRTASQVNLAAFGNAFAGRGADLNATIRQLPATLQVLTPVATNLANPTTRLDNFFKQLEITTGTIAPVAGTFSRLNTTMANTWHAFSADPQALKDTISKSPPTLDAGTTSFRTQIPFLRDVAAFSKDFNTATAELRGALPTLNSALRVGVAVTQRSVNAGTYPKLQDAMTALRDLAQAPTTGAALRGATATIATLVPQLRFLGPYVTVCNYWNYFWDLAGEHFSQPDPTGTAESSLLNFGPQQQDSLNQAGSPTPANGQNVTPNSEPPGTKPDNVPQAPEYFHGAAYGAAVTNQGLADCEPGQRGYIHGGQMSDKFGPPNYFIEVDAHTPLGYRHGSTYAKLVNGVGVGRGPDRVPAGETFTREPGGSGAVPP
jgi:virulence factor Mce-like protein